MTCSTVPRDRSASPDSRAVDGLARALARRHGITHDDARGLAREIAAELPAPPTRDDLVDRVLRGDTGDYFGWECTAAGTSAEAVYREADALRAGEAAAAAVVAAMRRDRAAFQRAFIECGVYGNAAEVRSILAEAFPGFAGSPFDQDCACIVERVQASMTQQMAKRPAASVNRPHLRARASIGVRTSSGQRRTRSANSGSGGGSSDDGEPSDEPPASDPRWLYTSRCAGTGPQQLTSGCRS